MDIHGSPPEEEAPADLAFELRNAWLRLSIHPEADSAARDLCSRIAYAIGVYDAHRSRTRIDPMNGRGLPPLERE